jgi:cbb3-type cytochrome oxidase subunit 3
MWKDAVRALETGALAETATVAFFIAFLMILGYAFTLSKNECQEALEMPLDDAEPVGGDGQ